MIKNICIVLLNLVYSIISINAQELLSQKVQQHNYYIFNNNTSHWIKDNPDAFNSSVVVGAERTAKYVPVLKNKKVAVFSNITSIIKTNNQQKYIHLIDSLLRLGINITKIFAPEHGIKSNADAGVTFDNEIDSFTQIPIISLYKSKKKTPEKKDFENIDVLIFDIQDVGVRFYTYISTLQLLLEGCIENGIELIILDRPNPNGFYVDGPTLNPKYKSFIGMQSIPIVHGMTVGEYAQMLYFEKWIKKITEHKNFKLTIIPCLNYTHKTKYQLPIIPSPNLQTMQSIYLYPSLCLFEGTMVSIGRGTEKPFEIYGFPEYKTEGNKANFIFTPVSSLGAKNPPYKNIKCYGNDLSKFKFTHNPIFTLTWIIDALKKSNKKEDFFKMESFKKLSGNDILWRQLLNKESEKDIQKSWQPDLKLFKQIRKKYLLYADF